MKRFLSMIMAFTMVFALGMTAYAAEGPAAETPKFSITINNEQTGHTYEAYQIFGATLFVNEKQEKVLSDIKWGSGVTAGAEARFGSAAEKAKSLSDSDAARAFANELDAYLNAANVKTSVPGEGGYTISGLEAGYYLIKDKNGSVSGHDAYTAYIMEVVGNVSAKPKSGVPQVEKKVKDTDDTTGVTTEWQDSADYDIGDDVPFQLTATLAGNVSGYNSYKIVFHDTLSVGLTYNNDAKVMFDGKNVTEHFTITPNPTDNTLEISCDNVKKFGATDNSVITVEYTARLNEQAAVGSAGNRNEAYLKYSNNPNPSGADNVGKTPADQVIVFTYEAVVNKVNEEGQALEGAGFTLYKKGKDGQFQAVGQEVKGDKMTTFTWKGLDDGEYMLAETTTPKGYNTMEPITFTITADHDMDAAAPQLTALNADQVFQGDLSTGKLTAEIENRPGLVLPSTGGAGTTMFYTVGGILVLAAGAMLLFKKRSTGNA